jgi:ribonuclease I
MVGLEWDKHGTCAKTDSLVGDQHSFFAATLKLREQAAPLVRTDF